MGLARLAPTVEDRPRLVERAQAASRATGLIGRADVVAEVAGFLAGAPDNRRGALTLVGPVGVGKASIVRAAVERLQAAGMTVHLAGPDPSGFGVSWVPIVSVLSAILGLPAKPDRDQFLEAIERAGLSERDASGLAELFGFPGPIAFLDGVARHAEACAAALALLTTGIREGEPVALGFLDVDRFDALSRELVLALAARLEGSRTRIIVTTSAPAQVPDDAARMTIAGLGPTAAHALFARHAGAARGARVTPTELIARTAGLPVALIHLGHWLAAGNDLNQAPTRIVDLVADQLGQLPVAARRVLQALAIQGKVASRARLTEVVGTDAEIGLAGLVRAGLVAVKETEVTIVDEVVAQIAIACTPVETRREHAAAILRTAGPDLSAAAVAHLAELAGSLHVALAANITAGDHARHRFDHARAGTLYHRAVTIARRLQAQGEAGAAESLVVASLRLADVLIQAGKHAAASGCLDEAELSGPTVTHLASLGRQRGRIAAGVGQAQLAVHLLQRAIGLALRAGQPEVCLDAYLDLADVLAGADQVTEAVEELSEALAVLSLGEGLTGGAGPERLWEIGWRLAHLHARAGDAQQAREVARAALLQAQRGHSMLGQGRLHVLLASLSRRLSDVSCALAHRAMARDAAEELAQRGMAGQIA